MIEYKYKYNIEDKLIYIPFETKVEVVEYIEGWYKIKCSDGSFAIVRPSNLRGE